MNVDMAKVVHLVRRGGYAFVADFLFWPLEKLEASRQGRGS